MKFKQSDYNILSEDQIQFLNHFFLHCPDSFADNIILKQYPKDHILINTDDSCAHVYIHLKGRLQAIEERTVPTVYSFTELTPIDIIGDYELFIQTKNRIITLKTLEPSTFILMPAAAYLHWIRTDANALFIRLQLIISQLTAESLSERQNIFMDNKTRLLNLVSSECNKKQFSEVIKINITHRDMASRIGCSIRTIGRIINQLQEEGLIDLYHGKIRVNHQQFEDIRSIVRAYLDYV